MTSIAVEQRRVDVGEICRRVVEGSAVRSNEELFSSGVVERRRRRGAVVHDDGPPLSSTGLRGLLGGLDDMSVRVDDGSPRSLDRSTAEKDAQATSVRPAQQV